MSRVVSLVLLAAYAVNVVRAAPQTVPTSPTICDGYMWGITIQLLENPGVPVYNRQCIFIITVWAVFLTSDGDPRSRVCS